MPRVGVASDPHLSFGRALLEGGGEWGRRRHRERQRDRQRDRQKDRDRQTNTPVIKVIKVIKVIEAYQTHVGTAKVMSLPNTLRRNKGHELTKQ